MEGDAAEPEEASWAAWCRRCATETEFTRRDVEFYIAFGEYVVCPICKGFISHDPGKRRGKAK